MTVSRRTLARLATTLAATAALGTALPAFAADPRVKFVTSEGDFVVELYPDKAPKTVENFLQYVKDKHYDGLIFHLHMGKQRVVLHHHRQPALVRR